MADRLMEIDLIARDGAGYMLVVAEPPDRVGPRTWLRYLQRKARSYLGYVVSGELGRDFPDSVGRPVRIVLKTGTRPDRDAWRFLNRLRQVMAERGVRFDVTVAPERTVSQDAVD